MRARAFKDEPRRSGSGVRRAVDRLVERVRAPERQDVHCSTEGYVPRMRGGTKTWPGLSPSLRGCYADPIELALEEHADRFPPVIPDPGTFETRHHYSHDPAAWPRSVVVVTVCKQRRLSTFVLKPGESLSVFNV